jgi:hypothetical protein
MACNRQFRGGGDRRPGGWKCSLFCCRERLISPIVKTSRTVVPVGPDFRHLSIFRCFFQEMRADDDGSHRARLRRVPRNDAAFRNALRLPVVRKESAPLERHSTQKQGWTALCASLSAVTCSLAPCSPSLLLAPAALAFTIGAISAICAAVAQRAAAPMAHATPAALAITEAGSAAAAMLAAADSPAVVASATAAISAEELDINGACTACRTTSAVNTSALRDPNPLRSLIHITRPAGHVTSSPISPGASATNGTKNIPQVIW